MQPRLTILQFQKEFPDDATCLEKLFRDRFGKPVCPKCGREDKYYRVRGLSKYACACGKHTISPKAGTVFAGSDTDLVKWFFAIYLFSQSRNGVAAMELQRELGVSYKCAWRMARAVRTLMRNDAERLSGDVEVDESMVGGHAPRAEKMRNKSIVFAAVERGGSVKAEIIPDQTEETLLKATKRAVEPGSRLLTDKLRAYESLATYAGYRHEAVNHTAKEYVRGDVHTNTVDGFFSQLSRSLSGTYHWVSQKHLPLYVAEFAFRQSYGRREDVHLFDLLLRRAEAPQRV